MIGAISASKTINERKKMKLFMLRFNEENSRIWSLNKKTPTANRGSRTATQEGDHCVSDHHYMGYEIYFNLFSHFLEKISGYRSFIKIFMEGSSMFHNFSENTNYLILRGSKNRIGCLKEKTQVCGLGYLWNSSIMNEHDKRHYRRIPEFTQMNFGGFRHV